jgi:hypothetical protein
MARVLFPVAAALAACAPASTTSPQENAMRSPSQAQGITAQGSSAGDQERAKMGPIPEPVSAAENPVPARPADSPAEARGRRTLSTAFVRVGPDGLLTVELRNGRVLVLRGVVMRPRDYCGVQVVGGPAGARYCGGYAEVAAARPGGAPPPEEPDLAAPNPLPRNPAHRN